MEAIKDSVSSGEYNGYGPSTGFIEARAAVAEYSAHQRENISTNDVILCSGCSCSLDICISCLAGPGQNILIPRPGKVKKNMLGMFFFFIHLILVHFPGFSIYKTLAEGFGVETRSYNLLPEKNWEIDLKRFEALIDANTAAIVITNPSNPCGSVFSKSHLQEIVRLAEKHYVPIIADEIYEHFVFPGKEYSSVSSLAKTVPVLSCGGLTKRFLVPGWRLGWIIIHDPANVFGEVRKVRALL
jgi:tyrosine aminotransferase